MRVGGAQLVEGTMKRTNGKYAAQPEHSVLRPKPAEQAKLTTADRVRLSLLAVPPRRP
jgi:hypothetical protein